MKVPRQLRRTSRAGSLTGRRRMSAWLTSEKIAVLAPTPNPIDSTAVAAELLSLSSAAHRESHGPPEGVRHGKLDIVRRSKGDDWRTDDRRRLLADDEAPRVEAIH